MRRRYGVKRYICVINNETGEIKRQFYNVKKSEIKNPMAFESHKCDMTDVLGNYYNFFFDRINKLNIEPLMLVRFLRLCCYLNYDNLLFIGKTRLNRNVRENEIGEILNLKRTSSYITKTYLIDKGLIYIYNGYIGVNSKYCIKGTVTIRKNVGCTRVFKDGYIELYNSISAKNQMVIYYMIKLLPYMSIRYNALCFNPNEGSKDLIVPFKFKDVWRTLDITSNTTKCNMKTYMLNTNVKDIPLVQIYNKILYINPAIFLKTNSIDNVKFIIDTNN